MPTRRACTTRIDEGQREDDMAEQQQREALVDRQEIQEQQQRHRQHHFRHQDRRDQQRRDQVGAGHAVAHQRQAREHAERRRDAAVTAPRMIEVRKARRIASFCASSTNQRTENPVIGNCRTGWR
jgi:hypothetical protein